MKSILQNMILFLSLAALLNCRGGVHNNNDHDYDGKNESTDGGRYYVPRDSSFDTTIHDNTNDSTYDSKKKHPIHE
jgi:hypothetical protein